MTQDQALKLKDAAEELMRTEAGYQEAISQRGVAQRDFDALLAEFTIDESASEPIPAKRKYTRKAKAEDGGILA